MNTVETTVELNGARYTIRKMPTRGYLALMDLLGRNPHILAAAQPGRAGPANDPCRALGPVLADLVEIVLAHCVRPYANPDDLPPQDARRLLSAARAMNPLPEIFEELNRFFAVMSPILTEAATRTTETVGNG